MKNECSRVPWNEWPEEMTDMESDTYGNRRNNNQLETVLDDIEGRIITLNISKFKSG